MEVQRTLRMQMERKGLVGLETDFRNDKKLGSNYLTFGSGVWGSRSKIQMNFEYLCEHMAFGKLHRHF